MVWVRAAAHVEKGILLKIYEGAVPYEEDDGDDDDDAVVAEVVAAAAIASLSTLSASLMCCGDGPGMLRKCWSPDALRLGVVDREPDVLDCEYGDSSRESLREGMESGCK